MAFTISACHTILPRVLWRRLREEQRICIFFIIIKCTCRQKIFSDLILFSVKRSQEEGSVQEIKEQLEALTAHMDYVQENITDCQTSIMEMEVQKFTL